MYSGIRDSMRHWGSHVHLWLLRGLSYRQARERVLEIRDNLLRAKRIYERFHSPRTRRRLRAAAQRYKWAIHYYGIRV